MLTDRKLGIADYKIALEAVSPVTVSKYIDWPAKPRTMAEWKKRLERTTTVMEGDFTSTKQLYKGEHETDFFKANFASYEKPGKPFSGDFVATYVPQGNPDSLIVVVGDGSTSLLTVDETPKEVKNMCSMSDGDLPKGDHLWAAFAHRHFSGSDASFPTLPEFQKVLPDFGSDEAFTKSESIYNFSYSIIGDNLDISRLIHGFQSNLQLFYRQQLGDEFLENKDNWKYLPSGVICVGIFHPDGAYDLAYTGDVDAFRAIEHGAMQVTSEEVTIHDRALDVLGRDNRQLVHEVASERIREVGNLNGCNEVRIKNFEGFVGRGYGVVITTDGLRLRNYMNLKDSRNLSHTNLNPAEIGAVLLYRNPLLYQMDLIDAQRQWKGSVRRRRGENWRPDDASYAIVKRK